MSKHGCVGTSYRRKIQMKKRRKLLLKKLSSRNVLHLTCESSTAKYGFCDVFVVGTSHISEESCREVRDVIRYLKPQVGFLECSPSEAPEPPEPLEPPEPPMCLLEIIITIIFYYAIMESANEAYLSLGWELSTMVEENILEVQNGNEFYVASSEIRKYGGKIILGDIPREVTNERLWAKMPLWDKLKKMFFTVYFLLFQPSVEDLEKKITQEDKDNYYEEFPSYYETVVDERDRYMSCLLHEAARKHSRVVAVVGRGHLEGIKKYWKQPVDLDELTSMPRLESLAATELSDLVFSIATPLMAIVLCIYYFTGTRALAWVPARLTRLMVSFFGLVKALVKKIQMLILLCVRYINTRMHKYIANINLRSLQYVSDAIFQGAKQIHVFSKHNTPASSLSICSRHSFQLTSPKTRSF